MNQLGKEEIQKIVLGALLLVGLVYCYFTMLLGPAKKQQEVTRKNITALEPEITKAKGTIAKSQAVEKNAPAARETVAQVSAMIPEGSPVAWFPPRIADFFKGQGIDKAATRLNNEFAEKELPGFRRLSWAIDLPRIDFAPFASAVAQLENDEPLVEVTSLLIETSREDVEAQHALLTVNNIVKQ